jgi:tRNA(Ile)-lysidine synthase
MFKLTHSLPNKYYVACSGGVDSMAVLHWSAIKSDRVIGAVYIHHGTGEFADRSEQIVREYCSQNSIPFFVYRVEGSCPDGRSKEDWWREQRYSFFQRVPGNEPIVLAHHLDDCIEEYLMCSLVRGYEGTIAYSNGRCERPFRKWSKKDIIDYAIRHGLTWIEDPSNNNTNFKRNFIRHQIIPQALQLNPGLDKLVKRAMDRIDLSAFEV